jgi:hypothetical protein
VDYDLIMGEEIGISRRIACWPMDFGRCLRSVVRIDTADEKAEPDDCSQGAK